MKPSIALSLLVIAVACGACDTSADVVGEGESPTSAAEAVATTSAVPLEPDDAIDCPNFVAAGDDPWTRRTFRESQLYGAAEKLQQYASQHSDAFGGLRMAHDESQPDNLVLHARLEIAFKSDINEHCWALRELVGRVNGFHVIRAAHSLADVQEAAEAAAARGARLSMAVQGQSVEVYLPGAAEEVAAELHATFGDMLRIRVAGWPYPAASDGEIEAACERVGSAEPLFPDLNVTLIPPDGPIHVIVDGDGFGELASERVKVVVENRGSGVVEFSTSQAVIPLYGDDGPVTVYLGYLDVLQAPSVVLQPGEAIEVLAILGMTPCTLDDGYLVRPGEYTVRGPFLGTLTEPVAVTVEAPPTPILTPEPVPSTTNPPTTLGS